MRDDEYHPRGELPYVLLWATASALVGLVAGQDWFVIVSLMSLWPLAAVAAIIRHLRKGN